MIKEKKLSLAGRILLFAATVLWGTSFFVTKGSVERFPVFFVLAFRFLAGGALLFAVFHEKTFHLTKKQLLWALLLGLTLAAGYVLQTYGVKLSGSASKAAFLTVTYCVLVPFLCFAFFREKPGAYSVVCAVLCCVGIGLVSVNGNFTFNVGDVLSLGSGIFFALQIIVGKKLIGMGGELGALPVAFLTVGLVCGGFSLVFERGQYAAMEFGWNGIFGLLYLAVFCTAAAQVCQIVGQKFTSANETALILSLEAVFGAIFGIAFGGDEVSARMIVGFALIFASVVICEIKGAGKRNKKENTQGEEEND